MHTLKSIVAVVLVSAIGIVPSCGTQGGGKTSDGGGTSGGGYLIELPAEYVVL